MTLNKQKLLYNIFAKLIQIKKSYLLLHNKIIFKNKNILVLRKINHLFFLKDYNFYIIIFSIIIIFK